MIAFAVEVMGGTVRGCGVGCSAGRRGESSTARPSPVTVTRTSLDGRAGPGLHTSVGTAGSWDGPPRCSCDGASLMGIGHHVELRLVPQLRQHLVHRGGPGLLACTPLLKLVHQASKLLRGGGTGRRPHPGGGSSRALRQRSRIFKNPVQKTEHHRDQGKQRLERIPRRRPTVGVDRLGGVPRGRRSSAFRPRTRRRLPGDGRHRPQPVERDAQNAAAANGCRDVALLAGPVGVMLVRHQMLGQLCRVVDGGSHQTVSPQPLDDADTSTCRCGRNRSSAATGEHQCAAQEQGIRQLIDGSGHVAEG